MGYHITNWLVGVRVIEMLSRTYFHQKSFRKVEICVRSSRLDLALLEQTKRRQNPFPAGPARKKARSNPPRFFSRSMPFFLLRRLSTGQVQPELWEPRGKYFLRWYVHTYISAYIQDYHLRQAIKSRFSLTAPIFFYQAISFSENPFRKMWEPAVTKRRRAFERMNIPR